MNIERCINIEGSLYRLDSLLESIILYIVLSCT